LIRSKRLDQAHLELIDLIKTQASCRSRIQILTWQKLTRRQKGTPLTADGTDCHRFGLRSFRTEKSWRILTPRNRLSRYRASNQVSLYTKTGSPSCGSRILIFTKLLWQENLRNIHGMSLLLQLLAQFLRCVGLLCRKDGLKAVVVQNLLLTQHLIVLNRGRQRGPSISPLHRNWLAFFSMFLSTRRLRQAAVVFRFSTFLRFKEILVRQKYKFLFSRGECSKPGPKGPSREIIAAVVEFKQRNPHCAALESRSNSQSLSESISNPMLSDEFSSNTSNQQPVPTVLPGSLSLDIAKTPYGAWTSLRPNKYPRPKDVVFFHPL